MKVSLTNFEELSKHADLFDQYRVFYAHASDIKKATAFIKQRLENRDSVILTAKKEDHLAGFTQLYPSFSSVSMKPISILNDLFVHESHRRKRVEKKLMRIKQKLFGYL
jgi:hypothetical protein